MTTIFDLSSDNQEAKLQKRLRLLVPAFLEFKAVAEQLLGVDIEGALKVANLLAGDSLTSLKALPLTTSRTPSKGSSRSPFISQIRDLLTANPQEWRGREIAQRVSCSRNSVLSILNKLIFDGEVERCGGGVNGKDCKSVRYKIKTKTKTGATPTQTGSKNPSAPTLARQEQLLFEAIGKGINVDDLWGKVSREFTNRKCMSTVLAALRRKGLVVPCGKGARNSWVEPVTGK
jgi:hypothetical protein